MNDIGAIRYLLDEVEEEEEKLDKYEKAIVKAKKQAKNEGKNWYYHFLEWDGNIPKKSTIDQNLKKIRKICLKLYKGEC